MKKAKLSPELESQIMDRWLATFAPYNEGEFYKMRKIALEGWNLIPEPKNLYDQSFLLVEMLCFAAIGLNNIEAFKDIIN